MQMVQINMAEADFFGLGPEIGAPVIHLPDGRRVSISRRTTMFPGGSILGHVGLMTYESRVGMFTWSMFNGPVWAEYWGETPADGETPNRTLSNIIENYGGPAKWIIGLMNHCSLQLLEFTGFNPTWDNTVNNYGQVVGQAISAWDFKQIANYSLLIPVPK